MEVVWPVPSWKERSCIKDTDSCSSHGVCTRAGECLCDPQYFGSTPETSCDSFCVGEIASSGQCHKDRTYYVGGIVDFSGPHAAEIISTMTLAVELVNNHTNGWFDSTRQVKLVLKIENAACGISAGETAVKNLNDWAVNMSETGTTLDGLISECSDSSKGAARFGNTIFLPHISFYATSVDLSDKDEYIYFARTCFTDEIHAELLVDVMEDVEVSPYLAVIHGPGSFLTSLAEFTVDSYEAKGHIILLQLEFIPSSNNTAEYAELLDTLAATGSPATVLVMSVAEVEKVIAAASVHPLFEDDSMLWVGIENWVDDSDTAEWNRQGMLGIVSPHVVTGVGGLTDAYLEVWESLDPDQYSDSDGDRTSVYGPTLCVVDAVFALALAFQEAIEEESGLEGDLLKRHTFSILTDQVAFDGVSGTIDFLNNGNRDFPVFGIVNYGTSYWIDNGYIDGDGGTYVTDYAAFLWPDGSTGKLNGNTQQQLYCPAGTESKTSTVPTTSSSSSSGAITIAACALCEVGFYSSYADKQACVSCPDGAVCADVGVVIPCISEGYWRAEPAASTALGDFQQYPIYACDIVHGCEGGCALNDTCGSGRDPSSVTCGVCMEDYYLNFEGDCLSCKSVDVYTPAAVFLVYAAVLLMVGMLYFIVLVVFSQSYAKSLQDTSSSSDSSSSSCSKEEILRNDPIEDNKSTSFFKLAVVVQSVSTSAKANFTQQNVRDAMITGKIILAFLQVMGAFFLLDISWTQATDIFTSYNINVFRGNEHVVACSTVSNFVPSYYFIVLNAFFLPLVLCLLLGLITGCVFHYYRLRYGRRGFQQHDSTQQTAVISKLLFSKVFSIFSRVMLWLCLLVYPSVCSIMLSVFNCRDFGNSGTFLRIDNSVSCENAEYDAYLSLAVFGILVYVVGIPCLFFMVIRRHLHRQQENGWEGSARFLHHGFVAEWKYYELFDLVRKLLLTSVSQFVASPSSSSQVLYLLLVNSAALFFITNAKPYINPKDNFLSTFLTFVECCAFLIALLIISEIAETEGYDKTALFNTLLALIFVGLFAIAPYTFFMKIDYCREKISAYTYTCCGKSPLLVSRLSAAHRWREDIHDLRESVVELERQSCSAGTTVSPPPSNDEELSSATTPATGTVTGTNGVTAAGTWSLELSESYYYRGRGRGDTASSASTSSKESKTTTTTTAAGAAVLSPLQHNQQH